MGASPQVGDTVPLEVLGRGRVDARVVRREEMDWHGIPGLAWRIQLELPDGTLADAMQIGEERLTFLDPRHRVADPLP
jgi:hypothetical protein